ncbi:hypothetical protein DFP73DRAFT_52811 [Morchella snyderi]|nr:hypothetical protein DFP73DRAFT_52811 [Morchella snyderi]
MSARRSIFNSPSSDNSAADDDEEDRDHDLPEHQPSALSDPDPDPGSESDQPPPSDDDEAPADEDDDDGEQVEEEEEDLPEDEQDARADNDTDNDSDPEASYRWGTHHDTRRTVQPFYGVIAALDRAHNSSLAAHLYSAHLIKRYNLAAPNLLPTPSTSTSETEPERRRNRTYSPTQLASDALLPRSKRFITNSWTSWPHPADHVPRGHEHEPHTLKSQPRRSHIDPPTYSSAPNTTPTSKAPPPPPPPPPPPSAMLEEVLTAAFLRAGKEKLRARGEAAGALVPVLDEDVSNHLLRPMVRSVISRLDGLLVGLHHERSYTKMLVAEEAAAAAATHGLDGARGVQQRGRHASSLKRPQARRKPPLSSSSSAGAAVRGRRRAVTPMTDTEAEEEEEEDEEEEPVRKRKRPPSPVARKWAKKRMTRLRLRDWSNVVGVAALTGFAGDVVQRTVGRCGVMFGETMGWRNVGRDDHLRGRAGGEEWAGARLEEEEEERGGGSGKGGREGKDRSGGRGESGSGGESGEGSEELYEDITRDGFLALVARPPRRDVGRRRPKYKQR